MQTVIQKRKDPLTRGAGAEAIAYKPVWNHFVEDQLKESSL